MKYFNYEIQYQIMIGIFILGYIGILIILTKFVTDVIYDIMESENSEIKQKLIKCYECMFDINKLIYENIFENNKYIYTIFVVFIIFMFILWYITFGIFIIFVCVFIGSYVYVCIHCFKNNIKNENNEENNTNENNTNENNTNENNI